MTAENIPNNSNLINRLILPIIGSLLIHALIVTMLYFAEFDDSEKKEDAGTATTAEEIIEAVAFDQDEVEAGIAKLKAVAQKKDQAKAAELAKLKTEVEKAKQQRQKEEQAIKDLKKQKQLEAKQQQKENRKKQQQLAEELKKREQQQKKKQQQLAEELKKQQQQIAKLKAEAKKAEDEKRQKIADAKKAADEAQKAKQAKEDAIKQQQEAAEQARIAKEKAEKAKEDAKREKQIALANAAKARQAQIDAENLRIAEETERKKRYQRKLDRARSIYDAKVLQALNNAWRRLKGASYIKNPKCVVYFTMKPDGSVITSSVRTIKSSGDKRYDDSVTAAVKAASPLPIPSDPELYSEFKEYEITFEPPE